MNLAERTTPSYVRLLIEFGIQRPARGAMNDRHERNEDHKPNGQDDPAGQCGFDIASRDGAECHQ